MKIESTTGCVCDSLTVDGVETAEMQIEDVKNVARKLIDAENDLSNLQYIIANKQIVEEYFHHKFTKSLLCPGSNSVKEFYKSLGYTENNNETLMMSKKI